MPLDPAGFGVVLGLGIQAQSDARAPRRRAFSRQRRNRVGAFAVARPAPGLGLAGANRLDDDLVGNHERGIEADAELADQRVGFRGLGVGGELVEEGAGSRARDGAERVDEVVSAHADAVVGEGQRLGGRIDRDGDRKRPAALDKLGLRQSLVAQLFAGVGGVGYQFAHKDVAVRIDRVDHQVQQPRDIGFELLGLGVGVGGGSRLRFSVGRQVGLMDNRIGNCGLAPARHMRRHARVSSVESVCLG